MTCSWGELTIEVSTWTLQPTQALTLGTHPHCPRLPHWTSLKQAGRLQFDCGNQARSCQITIWSDEPKEVCFFTLWFGQLEGSWMGLKTFSDLSAQTSVP